IPIYGFSAVLLHLFGGQLVDQTYAMVDLWDIVFVFITIMGVTTLLELIGGSFLMRFFRARWWDYSSEKYSYKGYVCLKYSLIWGIFGTVLYLAVHIPFVVPFIRSLDEEAIRFTVQVLTVYALFDAIMTLILLFNFKKWMVNLKNRLEILMQKLDRDTSESESGRLHSLRAAVASILSTIRSNTPMDEIQTRLDHVKKQLSSVKSADTDKDASILQRIMSRITSSHFYKGFPNLKINLKNHSKSNHDSSDEDEDHEGL
ncbi:MAG: putative ABC transporter permease, partial [Candidatus Izemoplasmataceae bacterium]